MSLARVQLYTEADIVYLDGLPPRIATMILALVRHQAVICAYDSGCVTLHYNGREVKPQLEKVALNSQKPLES